jgi:L-alanine-DL-glutamate epimerase-like enolase superfamily enzyme
MVARIRSVSVCAVRVPLDRVTSFSTRTVHARDYCLVKVQSADNVVGIGFCYSGSTAGSIVRQAVQDLLAPMLIGQESTRVEGLWERMYHEAILHGRAGSVMRGISILDNAIWDLNARTAGLPLYRYLGCWAEDTVPAYASGGYYVDGKTAQGLAEELAAYVRTGFRQSRSKSGASDSPRKKTACAQRAKPSAQTCF